MAINHTEMAHELADGLDLRDPLSIVTILADAQVKAAGAVGDAGQRIAEAAWAAAGILQAGGRIAYVGAGSAGLMALADTLELPGTFGIPRERIVMMLYLDVQDIGFVSVRLFGEHSYDEGDVLHLCPKPEKIYRFDAAGIVMRGSGREAGGVTV